MTDILFYGKFYNALFTAYGPVSSLGWVWALCVLLYLGASEMFLFRLSTKYFIRITCKDNSALCQIRQP